MRGGSALPEALVGGGKRHEIGDFAFLYIEHMFLLLDCIDGKLGRRTAMGEHEPSVFEAVTRQMVEALSEELREIRHRVDGLLWMGRAPF